jgi:hypothetical protein
MSTWENTWAFREWQDVRDAMVELRERMDTLQYTIRGVLQVLTREAECRVVYSLRQGTPRYSDCEPVNSLSCDILVDVTFSRTGRTTTVLVDVEGPYTPAPGTYMSFHYRNGGHVGGGRDALDRLEAALCERFHMRNARLLDNAPGDTREERHRALHPPPAPPPAPPEPESES